MPTEALVVPSSLKVSAEGAAPKLVCSKGPNVPLPYVTIDIHEHQFKDLIALIV